jgi:hypothetical protein
VPAFDEDGGHAGFIGEWWSHIDDPAVRSEPRDVLSSVVSALPAQYRAATILHDVEGLSMAETADVLGTTIPAAKTRGHRARLFLRTPLATFMAEARTGPDRSSSEMRSRSGDSVNGSGGHHLPDAAKQGIDPRARRLHLRHASPGARCGGGPLSP